MKILKNPKRSWKWNGWKS